MSVPGRSWTPPAGARTRLVLVRHGATDHSAERRLSGRNDLPLAPGGRAQAAALAARAFPGATVVVSSPLRRARETAGAIAAALELPVTIEDDFAELDFGAFEGLSFGEAGERFPDELAAWTGSPEVAPPGGESFAALDERVRRGRDTLLARHPGRTVVVVTHVSPIKLLVRAALDAPFSSIYRLHLDTASVSVLDHPDGGAASLRLFNDTYHLL